MADLSSPDQDHQHEDVTPPVAPTPASAEQPTAQAPTEPPQKQNDQPAPAPAPAPAPTAAAAARNDSEDDDEDSDLDDLDDVLDDFSKPKPAPAQPAPAQEAPTSAGDFDEDAFLKQLEADMANMMSPGAFPPGAGTTDPNLQSSVEQGADAFAKQLEESGIPPGDFLKQLLADVMAEEGGDGSGAAAAAAAALAGAGAGAGSEQLAPSTGSGSGSKNATGSAPPSSAKKTDDEQPESFNDAIQRTMERMKQSGDRATEAASTDDGLSDDMVAQLLKAMEAGAAGAGDEGDLTKMFMGMMEQLSNKEMLYEPMKELDGKFGPWLEKNKAEGKVALEDMTRYEAQAKVVKQIVEKFEEKTYSDDDPKCREYVWERMQEMQAAGSPPEELISNPLMEEALGGGAAAAAGAGGVPDCPQQ